MRIYTLAILIGLVVLLFSVNSVTAAPCTPGTSQSTLCNPAERPGGFVGGQTPAATNFIEFIVKIVFILAGFATLLPIIAIIYAGFSMVISQGNPEAITSAKNTLTWAVGGFVLAILSYVVVAALIQLLGANNIPNPLTATDTTVQNPLVNPNPALSDQFVPFVYNMLQNFLPIIGVAALLFIIVSGFRYVTSAGNEEQASQAKTALTWSIFGLITILLSYVIIKATGAIFGIS